MKILQYILALFIFLTAYSCAFKYDIESDKELNVNFNKYRTFTIIHDDHGFELGANPINKQRIDRAIEKEFKAIGYEYSEEPELQISWFIKVDTKLEQGIYNTYYSRRMYDRSIEVYEYQIGSLVIDIVDARSGQVVWHCKASAKVYDEMPDVENKINEVVKEIFKSYKKDIGINERNGYVFK